jgi:manganese oxidase
MKEHQTHEPPTRCRLLPEPAVSRRGADFRVQGSFVATAVLLALLGAAGPARAGFDIPTGARPSPLYGAQPFTQQMLLFEEFGTEALEVSSSPHYLPSPGGCDGPAAPATYTGALDSFLAQPLFPAPTREANTTEPNPWNTAIGGCLGRPVTGAIEGRPPGEDFAHQRWGEFAPEVYFQSAQAGSRPNGGLRDAAQLHRYQAGEFGPGGLYHNTVGKPGFAGTTRGVQIRFHPNMPVQSPKSVWTFDGTLPPKLLMAPYGSKILFRHYNALPISDAANNGFGRHTITTHEHNGHNPAESDGFAGAFFYPGQYYDYRWPMVLAGHDSINGEASDPRAGTPDGQGGIKKIRGDWRETMSTHWFHDHMLDFTAQNVYKGNAAMMNYYSALDRGREPASEAEAKGSGAAPGYGCQYADPTGANPNNVNLCLPSGSALDWGNRDYDVNLVLADKAFDAKGQLFFNVFNTDGFLGDVATVNFLYKPYLDVRARRYRFRILNGSVSRYWKVAIVDQAGKQVPFHLIANDGNIMQHAVPFPNMQAPEGLPEQGIAERFDIVVDFSKYKDGDKLYFVNLLEHDDGKGPKQAIPLAKVLNGSYAKDGCPKSCDPVVGKFMELRVKAYSGKDLSMNPADYVEGKKSMIPLPGFTKEELANAKERTFEFGRSGDTAPWSIKTDDGKGLSMEPDRISAAPDRNSVEIWHLKNGGQGWGHPVHIHFEEGQILQRGGKAPPIWEKYARKDVYRIGPLPDSTDTVSVALRVREFLGTYVEHCHNTQHEDHAMLLRWDSQDPGQVVPIQAPYPNWDGVHYTESNTTDVPTFKSGKATNFLQTAAAPVAANDLATTQPDDAVKIAVLANDSCVGGCNLRSVLIGGGPSNGTASPNSDGSVTYDPTNGFLGQDSFTYTMEDTSTGRRSNLATVTIVVGSAQALAKPFAVNDAAATTQGTVVAIDVIGNDTNCASCSVAIVSQPIKGSAVANNPATGKVTYTPAAGFVGTDTFTYTATNAAGTSNVANVNVTVAPNPVTDIVTITEAELRRSNTELRVRGYVSLLNNAPAATVSIFAGGLNAAGTACSGTYQGKVTVARDRSWSYSGKGVAATKVCVESANGGVATAPL